MFLFINILKVPKNESTSDLAKTVPGLKKKEYASLLVSSQIHLGFVEQLSLLKGTHPALRSTDIALHRGSSFLALSFVNCSETHSSLTMHLESVALIVHGPSQAIRFSFVQLSTCLITFCALLPPAPPIKIYHSHYTSMCNRFPSMLTCFHTAKRSSITLRMQVLQMIQTVIPVLETLPITEFNIPQQASIITHLKCIFRNLSYMVW